MIRLTPPVVDESTTRPQLWYDISDNAPAQTAAPAAKPPQHRNGYFIYRKYSSTYGTNNITTGRTQLANTSMTPHANSHIGLGLTIAMPQ